VRDEVGVDAHGGDRRIVRSRGSGRIALVHSDVTRPGVSAPSSVVRSTIEIAISIAANFVDFLIDRVESLAARASSAHGVNARETREEGLQLRFGLDGGHGDRGGDLDTAILFSDQTKRCGTHLDNASNAARRPSHPSQGQRKRGSSFASRRSRSEGAPASLGLTTASPTIVHGTLISASKGLISNSNAALKGEESR